MGGNSTFSEHGYVANQIKENHECSNILANILPADTPTRYPTPLDPGDGVNRSKVIFLEHGHVAYQMWGNHEMQQLGSKYFACRPLPTPMTIGRWGQKLKIQLFQNIVMLHIELKGIMISTTW